MTIIDLHRVILAAKHALICLSVVVSFNVWTLVAATTTACARQNHTKNKPNLLQPPTSAQQCHRRVRHSGLGQRGDWAHHRHTFDRHRHLHSANKAHRKINLQNGKSCCKTVEFNYQTSEQHQQCTVADDTAIQYGEINFLADERE